MKLVSQALFPLLALVPAAQAGVHYVDSTLTTGNNDGSSWADAWQGPYGLQLALNAAQPGDEYWVRMGRYMPAAVGQPEATFALRQGVAIYGGFLGNETYEWERQPLVNTTTLSGDLADDDGSQNYVDNCFHVVTSIGAAASGILDGFTISGGFTQGQAGDGFYGGGILCRSGAAPVFRNCIVAGNIAHLGGGGAYVSFASPRFEHVSFLANHCNRRGGGVFLSSTSDVVFEACEVRDNTSASGAGLEIADSTATVLRDCVVLNNHAHQVSVYRGAGGIEASNSNVDLVNVTLAGNTSNGVVTGGVSAEPPALTLANCIVFFNQGSGGGGQLVDNISNATAHHCCIEGGLAGPGNIGSDPQLPDLAQGGGRTAAGSPCSDAGDNSAVPVGTTTDFQGSARFADDPLRPDTGAGGTPIVDMGALEVQNSLYTTFCAADGSLATACPCGNTGSTGRGCRSSDFFSPGALLLASGSASADSVVLSGSEILPSGTCVFLQGDQPNTSGVVFGDGVRCVAGSLKRLYIKSAVEGSASAPAWGEASIRARSAVLGDPIAPGSQRFYQVYYRDPDLGFCPAPAGNSWNVSSGVIVNW